MACQNFQGLTVFIMFLVLSNSVNTSPHDSMNDYILIARTDRDLHQRIRKLAYLANISRSAVIRKLLQIQSEKEQLEALID